MKIARVELTGFKSFVDPCEMRIMPGLTGVVGPNGCGKSNLLEAIRWVMGEGSPKSLRGSAMDDVIFAGTVSRPQRQFAEVSILAERDDDEVEVVRRIERGAGSAYRINGRDARARDAQLVFADAATGAHSPALVSQGRIGAIIAAKPTERRQMLEEAAGISGLHVRRREAEIRLRATKANLSRVEEAAAEQEARIAVLRRQARSAERYRKLSDDIRVAEGRLIFARWRDASTAADLARTEAKTADEAVFAASEAQRVAVALSNEATGVLAIARNVAQAARDAAADARHRLATVDAERQAIEKRIALLRSQQDALDDDRARESELARDAGEALVRLAVEGEAMAASIDRASANRPALAEAIVRAEEECRATEIFLAQTVAEVARDGAERRIAEAALAAAKLDLDKAVAMQTHVAAALSRVVALDVVETDRDVASKARRAAEARADVALAALEQAERCRDIAAEARTASEAIAATASTALASLKAEAEALSRDVGAIVGALAKVRAAPGFEIALAAALADDLNASIGDGPRRWVGAEIAADDPLLPVGDALADHVVAPLELARRLAQIAVVESDDGCALRVGQRLVTTSGYLRRWDGFESDGAAAAMADGMKRRNRLLIVEAELPAARLVATTATENRHRANGTLNKAISAVSIARMTRDQTNTDLRAALRVEDQAGAAVERARAQSVELADRLDDAKALVETATTQHDRALSTIAALAPMHDQTILLAAEEAAQDARKNAARLRAELIACDARLSGDKTRQSAIMAESADWRARSGKAGKRVEEMAKRAAILDEEARTLAPMPAQVDARAAMIGIESATLADDAMAAVEAERAAELALKVRDEALAIAGEVVSNAREVRAGAQARTENQDLRRVEMGRVSGECFECPAVLLPEKLAFNPANVGLASDESARLERAMLDRERLGPVNLVAESELAEIESSLQTNAAEIAELTEAVHRLRGSIGSLNREGRNRLRAAFETVDGHFRTLFSTLFNGGEAHLALINSDDPLEAGLEIMAQPPGKKLSSLSLLSGGEQALTAVALIFGLFLTNPAPLCVLDEVDAPLDDANVERFCDLLDVMTRETDTRYLIVTHNAVTMSRMHRLYGVTMVEQGISRLVSVDLGGAEALLAAE